MDRFNTRSGLQPNKIKRKEHKAMQLNRQLPRLVPIKDYCTCCIKPVVSIKQEKEEAAKISSSWQGMKTRGEEGLMRRKVKVWSRFREGSRSDGPATWGTFRLAPTHKAPLCVCICPLTGFDRPVFRCSSGSNVFEMEIYRGILFQRRLRSCLSFTTVQSLSFRASLIQDPTAIFTFWSGGGKSPHEWICRYAGCMCLKAWFCVCWGGPVNPLGADSVQSQW